MNRWGKWDWGPPRERMFEKGDLKYLFLDLLREKPRHGYDLIRAVEERSGGRYSASPGTVYPILQMLEDLAYVTVTPQDGRKTYTVTPSGEAFLDQHAETVDEIRKRASGAWDRGSERDAWHELMREIKGFLGVFRQAHHDALTPGQLRRLRTVIANARREFEAILAADED